MLHLLNSERNDLYLPNNLDLILSRCYSINNYYGIMRKGVNDINCAANE